MDVCWLMNVVCILFYHTALSLYSSYSSQSNSFRALNFLGKCCTCPLVFLLWDYFFRYHPILIIPRLAMDSIPPTSTSQGDGTTAMWHHPAFSFLSFFFVRTSTGCESLSSCFHMLSNWNYRCALACLAQSDSCKLEVGCYSSTKTYFR
jgi:hypothetical protein